MVNKIPTTYCPHGISQSAACHCYGKRPFGPNTAGKEEAYSSAPKTISSQCLVETTLSEEDFFNAPDICVKNCNLNDPIHADLTGRFPIVSFKGMQYLLVACWHGYFHFELMAS